MPDRDEPIVNPDNASAEASSSAVEPAKKDTVLRASIGSGLLAQQPTPQADEHVTVTKVCPQCGGEYETGDRFCPKDGAPLRPKGGDDPMIGRVIADRYLILARLGEGGMGRVYVAEHVKMNRQCAIKVMNPSLVNDPESAKRFAREASNAARILHPNVAAVFDYGEADKVVYLVMEYVDGESLAALLAREGALDARRAIDIGRQIADGLTAAHELGIVHRDLKPDNVIIARRRDGRETAKVVDFGIAKAVSESSQDALTRSGLVIGTPEYMSPEQLLGDPVDARADIYALGCMLYQMLSGTQPFDADTREQMIRRRLNEPPPHLRETAPSIPRRLDTLIAHMLARSPGDRLASAAEASAALDPSLTLAGWDPSTIIQGVPKSPPGTPTVIRPSNDPMMRPTVPMEAVKSSARRIVVGAGLGSGALLVALMLWYRRENASTTPPVATPAVIAPAPAATPPLRDTVPATTPPPVNAESVAAAQKKAAAASADSAAKAAPKTPTVPPDEAAIRRALDHFAVAVSGGEIAILKEFPAMPKPLLDAIKLIYDQGEHVRAVVKPYEAPKITGDRVEVPITVQVSYQRRDSKSQESYPFRYRTTLTKHGAKWELTGLAVQ